MKYSPLAHSMTSTFTLRQILLAVFVFLTSAIHAETEDVEQWYQIEVIIFSQQDLFEAELPRTDIELSYPDNWVYLIDPNQPEDVLPGQSSSEPLSEKGTEVVNAVLDANMNSEHVPDKIPDTPFVMLDKDLQQLGPDHYTLRRAPGYRVLYHQSWRQPGSDFKNGPWVIVQGGNQFDDHFELEGSIRLVKSRHLHIQANLWKTSFIHKSQVEKRLASVEAPKKPADTAYESSLLGQQALEGEGSEINSLELEAPTRIIWPMLPQQPVAAIETLDPQPDVLLGTTPKIESDTAQVQVQESNETIDSSALPHHQEIEKQYEIEKITVLKQSLKLSLGEMGYLDHPNMGVLVIVNKYEPEIF